MQRAAAAAAAAAAAVSLTLFAPPPPPAAALVAEPPPLYATSFIAARSPPALSPRWDLRSTSSTEATLLLITNDTPSTVVGLWWVGYDGKEVAYASLAPGATHIQPTFASHVWVVRAHDTAAVLVVLMVLVAAVVVAETAAAALVVVVLVLQLATGLPEVLLPLKMAMAAAMAASARTGGPLTPPMALPRGPFSSPWRVLRRQPVAAPATARGFCMVAHHPCLPCLPRRVGG